MASAPLEIWSSSGVQLINLNTRIARQLGEFETGTSNGGVNIPELGDPDNSWFIATAAGGGRNIPMIIRNGASLSWRFNAVPNESNASMRILWGVK